MNNGGKGLEGIYNSGIITNSGTINIESNGVVGIRNNGGTITDLGTINIEYSGSGFGIYNEGGSTIANSGTINVENSGAEGIYNGGVITDEGCGTIMLTGSGTYFGNAVSYDVVNSDTCPPQTTVTTTTVTQTNAQTQTGTSVSTTTNNVTRTLAPQQLLVVTFANNITMPLQDSTWVTYSLTVSGIQSTFYETAYPGYSSSGTYLGYYWTLATVDVTSCTIGSTLHLSAQFEGQKLTGTATCPALGAQSSASLAPSGASSAVVSSSNLFLGTEFLALISSVGAAIGLPLFLVLKKRRTVLPSRSVAQ